MAGIDLKGSSFTWEKKLGRLLRLYRGGLDTVDIMTFHTWSYYGFFKPTLHEVYSAIAQFVPDWSGIRFFEMLDSGSMDAKHIMGDYHWCRCRLYGKERTDVIDTEWEKDRMAVERMMEIGR